jgi:exopolysaccharide biosynthesis protein
MSELVEVDSQRTKFIENIQKWVMIDSQIKLINEKVKKARETKQQLLEEINTYVTDNKIENTKIEISDGELRFYEKKDYQPITFGYVEDSLGKIISDKKQVDFIMNYLRENREITVSKDIRRNYKNRSASFS